MLILFLTRAGSGAVVVRRCSKTHATSPTTEPPLQRTGGSYSGPMSGDEIWTIGHWVCEQGVFLEALDSAGIGAIADARAQPGSRRSPQFSRDAMPEWLGEAGRKARCDGHDFAHCALPDALLMAAAPPFPTIRCCCWKGDDRTGGQGL